MEHRRNGEATAWFYAVNPFRVYSAANSPRNRRAGAVARGAAGSSLPSARAAPVLQPMDPHLRLFAFGLGYDECARAKILHAPVAVL